METNALTQITQPQSIMSDLRRLQECWEIAAIIAESDFLPEQFRRKPANVIIAMEMAHRMGNASPLAVMQHMYIVHGKPAFSASWYIAMFAATGEWTPLGYEYGEDGKSCRCYATYILTDMKAYGPKVSIEMAKKEGWYGKKGSKWPNMPQVMLNYRAATFFIRQHAPHVLMGMHTSEEMRDMASPQTKTDERQNVTTTLPNRAAEPDPELVANLRKGYSDSKRYPVICANMDTTPPEPEPELPLDAAPAIADAEIRAALGNPPTEMLQGWLYDTYGSEDIAQLDAEARGHIVDDPSIFRGQLDAWAGENGYE